MPILLTLLLSLLVLPFASAYAPVAQLLQIHSSTISQLKLDPRTSPLPLDPPLSSPDLFYLRHILEYDEGIEEDDEGGINLLSGIQNTLAWRRGDGLEIVMSASSAIEEARKDGGENAATSRCNERCDDLLPRSSFRFPSFLISSCFALSRLLDPQVGTTNPYLLPHPTL